MGFRVTAAVAPPEGDLISGVVFIDRNRDGDFDPLSEAGIPRANVSISAVDSTPGGTVAWTYTDQEGRYGFADLGAGVYRVAANPTDTRVWEPTSPNPLIVTLVEGPDGNVQPFPHADFGFFQPGPPDPLVRVFGPLGVGPGSETGTRADTSFVHDDLLAHEWSLDVMPPLTIAPWPMAVSHAHVTINHVVVWTFDCSNDSLPCLPMGKFRIPARLIGQGLNSLEIVTEGDERTLLFYSILRSP
jgi:hypothetical protein